LKTTIRSKSLHKITNGDGVRVVNFALSENLIVKSTTFPHPSIYKYSWTSDEKTYSQIDHVFKDGI
jgi:hypothetical protein